MRRSVSVDAIDTGSRDGFAGPAATPHPATTANSKLWASRMAPATPGAPVRSDPSLTCDRLSNVLSQQGLPSRRVQLDGLRRARHQVADLAHARRLRDLARRREHVGRVRFEIDAAG